MRRLALALFLVSTPALAQTAISEAQVRAFVSRQQSAWNAGRLDAYFDAFTPEARFTDQAYVGDKAPVPYGTSTLAQARTQTARALARSKRREASQITQIRIAPDGRSVQVVSKVDATIEQGGKVRRVCAYRGQALVLRSGRLLSHGHTDTIFKCASR